MSKIKKKKKLMIDAAKVHRRVSLVDLLSGCMDGVLKISQQIIQTYRIGCDG